MNITELLTTMDYGPNPEAADEAQAMKAQAEAETRQAAERDQHWARVGAASFLTDAEKRAALGLPPVAGD